MTTKRLDFNWKYKNYELRACPKKLVRFHDEPNETIDFVKWELDSNGKRYCYFLAYWIKNSQGYELHFVRDELFKDIKPEDIKVVCKALDMAQKTLDRWA